jgi:hypothetical protein
LEIGKMVTAIFFKLPKSLTSDLLTFTEHYDNLRVYNYQSLLISGISFQRQRKSAKFHRSFSISLEMVAR